MIVNRLIRVLLSLTAVLASYSQVSAQVPAPPGAHRAPRITLSLLDTDVRDALRMVAKQAEINLVLSNEVEGTITIDLDDVPLPDALDAILNVGGFQHTLEDNIVTVVTLGELLERASKEKEYQGLTSSPIPREALVIELRYVDAERMLPIVKELLSEAGTVSMLLTSDHVFQHNGDSNPSSGRGNLVTPGSARSSESAALQIGSRLSTSTRGQPAKSHTLVVVDQPERLEVIKTIVAEVDKKPVQVLIEARFVEVVLDDTSKMGFDWKVLARATGAVVPHTFPLGNSSLGPFNPRVNGGGSGGVFPAAPNSVTTPADAGLFTFGALDFSTFSAVLQMIQTDSRVQMVSNPSIVVVDRHTATILVGERYPILSATISEFGTVTEQLDHYEPIGVQLEVTPSVLNDDEVQLVIRPSTSSLGALVTGSTGISVVRINSRQIDTSVSVKDRQTVVLGGLITTREVEESSRVPFLGSVPLLKHLFTFKSRSTVRVDLVIFLTVTIIHEHGLNDEQREMFEQTSAGMETISHSPPSRSRLPYVAPVPRYSDTTSSKL